VLTHVGPPGNTRGLKGLCGSLAIYLARLGAKHLVVLCRSGYADEKSQAILANVYAEGCQVDLFEGDVSNIQDVKRVFREATVPIRGLIQGAMVLRVILSLHFTLSMLTRTRTKSTAL